MKKVIRNYLFTLCILLLSGYSDLNANADQSRIHYVSTVLKNTELSKLALPIKSNTPTVNYTVPGTTGKFKNISEEKEEESCGPFFTRTYTLIGSYFAVYYKKVSSYIFCDIKKRSYLDAHWFYSSSRRYIILQVMRI